MTKILMTTNSSFIKEKDRGEDFHVALLFFMDLFGLYAHQAYQASAGAADT
ncbi:hypothetical protein EMIT074MI3_10954 [Bacillus licheniformis]